MVHIPKPCHEDWQQMTPVDQGRFCQSCAKQVVDFSLMTDQQILQYISKAAGGMCGRFATDQLQRPLLPAKQEKKRMWWLAVVVTLMMVFGKLGAQKKNHKSHPKENIIKLAQSNLLLGEVVFVSKENTDENIDTNNDSSNDTASITSEITVWRKKGEKSFTVIGKIEDARDNSPIPYASVIFKNTRIGAATDEKGCFRLTGNSIENHSVISISSVGFDDRDVEIILKDSQEVREDTSYNIHGKVIEADGNPIAFATIKTKDGKQSAITDANGLFQITLPANKQHNTLIVGYIGFNEKEISVSVKDTSAITVLCQQSVQGLTEVVAGKIASCRKPKITDTIPTLIRKVFHTEAFTIYPNPAQRGQSITIDAKRKGNYSIQIFNNSGKLLQVKEFNATESVTQTTIDIPSTFAAGMYYIRLVDDKTKKQYTNKIVVR